jgi:hypothetical protein
MPKIRKRILHFLLGQMFIQTSLTPFAPIKNAAKRGIIHFVAVREGFEPSVRLYNVRQFSKLLVSATHPPHRRKDDLYRAANLE